MAPPVAPLDTLESAVSLARVRLNDAIAAIGGDVVTDAQPFTLEYINGAWRRLQEYAVSIGFCWLMDEAVFLNVPAAASADPAVQVYIDWSTYFDGAVNQAAPVLPQNLIAPTDLYERITSASPVPGNFYAMDELKGGLPSVAKGMLNRRWQWRKGALHLPGTRFATDIQISYAAYFPDFVADSTTPFATQTIPVLRLRNPIAWYICSEAAHARNDLNASYFDEQAKAAMDLALTANGDEVP